jgi:hypothetical protein
MKLGRILITTAISGSLFTAILAEEPDHLKNFEKDVDAVKGDMVAAFGFVDSACNLKVADISKLDKDLQDFQATVDLAIKQRKQAIFEIFKSLLPLESRILATAPDKKPLFDKIRTMMAEIK